MIPDGYRIDRGLLWPASDIGGPAAMLATAGNMDIAYRHCRAFDVAVQAGGHCGIWPEAMGRRFSTVYTFEPDAMNFRCLCANAPAETVFKFNAALGAAHHPVDLQRRPDNTGAHRVEGRGPIPTILVDDLDLAACDLIYLDVEGYELLALHGAYATISRHRPVIVIEDKGCSEAYGVAKGETEQWLLQQFRYRVVDRVHRDVVLAP